MRLLTFDDAGTPRAGVLDGDQIVPLREGVTVLDIVRRGLPVDLDAWLPSWPAPRVDVDDARLLAPLLPPTIRDFVAFEEHVEGVRKSIERNPGIAPEWYDLPTFYFSNPHAVVGPEEPVAIPDGCSRLDYELEVGIVIGTPGSNVRPEDGLSHVFGLTILNDWSARDIQGREMKVGLGPAKGKDFANTIGPVLVTMDEFAGRIDGEGFLNLGMAVSVNGVETGRDLLSNMGWPIGDLVAYASRETWVHPGDLLGSGTCGNGGCLAELWGRSGGLDPRPLVAGDVVTMWVEGIGRISTSVVEGRAVPPIPAARPRPRTRPTDVGLSDE
jgi:2-keto-4-pentenoate hydratase/2-oxohepta-3-ene-1,7-dioic acid hydratase in catechol pathway